MAKQIIEKHMKQNADSYDGFAVGFTNLFRRACRRHTRGNVCPFENAVDSFNEHAINLRVQ